MAKVDDARAGEAQRWMETVLGVSMPNFFEDIRDGVYLCDTVNKIKPGTCKKYKKSKIAYVARTNIQIYLEGCKKLGVPETDRFESRDLYDQQRLGQVVNNIFSLSAISRKHGFSGPFIGAKYSEKNERHFSQAVLNKGKSAIPNWNKGSIQNKTGAAHDSVGIVRSAGLSKHTGVQSKMEKGSIARSTGSAHDSVGIVRSSGLAKHTGAQSAWEKGSLRSSSGPAHDSVGIVRSAGLSSHTGVQSAMEKGSIARSTGATHDSVGIVRDSGLSKHTGVQSMMEKGAKSYDRSDGHDSVGIVRDYKK